MVISQRANEEEYKEGTSVNRDGLILEGHKEEATLRRKVRKSFVGSELWNTRKAGFSLTSMK